MGHCPLVQLNFVLKPQGNKMARQNVVSKSIYHPFSCVARAH